MQKKTEHTQIGIASIVLGVFGLIFYIIGWFFFSFVDNRLYGMILGLILSILAFVLGYFAKKHGDFYGNYGMILGGLIIITTFIIVILTTPASVKTG